MRYLSQVITYKDYGMVCGAADSKICSRNLKVSFHEAVSLDLHNDLSLSVCSWLGHDDVKLTLASAVAVNCNNYNK